jgi:hypothetical protein
LGSAKPVRLASTYRSPLKNLLIVEKKIFILI